jgi:hypothetical protein
MEGRLGGGGLSSVNDALAVGELWGAQGVAVGEGAGDRSGRKGGDSEAAPNCGADGAPADELDHVGEPASESCHLDPVARDVLREPELEHAEGEHGGERALAEQPPRVDFRQVKEQVGALLIREPDQVSGGLQQCFVAENGDRLGRHALWVPRHFSTLAEAPRKRFRGRDSKPRRTLPFRANKTK